MKAGPFQASSGVQQARCSRHPSHNQPTGKPTSSSLTIEALEQKLTHSSQLSKYLTRRDTAPRVAPENVVSCCTLGRQAESANKPERKGREGELEGRRAGWGRLGLGTDVPGLGGSLIWKADTKTWGCRLRANCQHLWEPGKAIRAAAVCQMPPSRGRDCVPEACPLSGAELERESSKASGRNEEWLLAGEGAASLSAEIVRKGSEGKLERRASCA